MESLRYFLSLAHFLESEEFTKKFSAFGFSSEAFVRRPCQVMAHFQLISQHFPGTRLISRLGLMHAVGTSGGPGHDSLERKPFSHFITTAQEPSVAFSPCASFKLSYLQLLSVHNKTKQKQHWIQNNPVYPARGLGPSPTTSGGSCRRS